VKETIINLGNACTMVKLVGSLLKNDPVAEEIIRLQEQLQALADTIHFRFIELEAQRLGMNVERELERDTQLAENAADKPLTDGSEATKACSRVNTLLEAALEKGVLGAHKCVLASRQAMLELRAEACRRNAGSYLEKDRLQFEEKGWIENAAIQMADKMQLAIRDAEGHGVPIAHPKLKESQERCKVLREQEGLRKREATSAKRKAEEAKAAAAKGDA